MHTPYLAGCGMTHFGTSPVEESSLIIEAITEALTNSAEITQGRIHNIDDIEAIVFANVTTSRNGASQNLTSAWLASLLQTTIPIIRTEASCAGGGKALWLARQLPYKNILVLAFDNVLYADRSTSTTLIGTAADAKQEQAIGAIFPALNALFAQRYMKEYGVTPDDLALVAYKNHQNAYKNPKAAFYGKEVSLEKIKTSPIIADPLRVHDCSFTTHGAVAVVLTEEKTDLRLAGSGFGIDAIAVTERPSLTSWPATIQAAKQAYTQAAITAQDIAFAEVHDAYTITEIMALDDLGFCKPGEGVYFARENKTGRSGDLPINTSGGLKARGHPISPTGLAQVYEISQQMRNNAGDRQIHPKTPWAITHNVGGVGGIVTVHVFEYCSL